MNIEEVRKAASRGLLDYTVDSALEVMDSGTLGKGEIAEICSICSDVMFTKRQYTDAVSYGLRSVEADPAFASGYSNLGWAEYWLGRNDEAVGHLRKAVELSPDDAEAHYRLGSVYNNALRRPDLAEEEFTRTLELNENHAFAWQQRGISFYQREEYEKAEADYRRASELGDSYSAYCLSNNGCEIRTPGEMVALGRDFWEQNDSNAAVDYFGKALEAGFETPEKTLEVLLELADKLSIMKLNEEAETRYDEAVELAPDSADALSRRGWHFYCISRDDDAEADMKRAIELDPGNPGYRTRLGKLYAVSGRPEQGLTLLDEAIAAHPLEGGLYQARALCHKTLGNDSKAKEDFSKADYLGDPEAQGNCRAAYGDQFAIDFFSAGIEKGQQNDYEGAVQQFRKAIEMFRAESRFQGDRPWRYTAKSLHNMGLDIHLAEGDRQEAISAVEEAIEMEPFYVDAWVTLGNISNSTGSVDRALECYTKAIQLQPNDGRGYYNRGRINMARRLFDEGVGDFTSAINLYQRREWKADAYYNRAKCHEGAGRIHEAIEDFNMAFGNGIQQAIQETFRLKDQYGIE